MRRSLEYWAAKAGLDPIPILLRDNVPADAILDRIFAVYDHQRMESAIRLASAREMERSRRR